MIEDANIDVAIDRYLISQLSSIPKHYDYTWPRSLLIKIYFHSLPHSMSSYLKLINSKNQNLITVKRKYV
jgi:hypothetical protein